MCQKYKHINITESTLSVIDNERDNITLKKEELQKIIKDTAIKTAEEVTIQFQDKIQDILENSLELRSRSIVSDIRKELPESKNELVEVKKELQEIKNQIAATQENESFLSKWFRFAKNKNQV